MIKFATITYSSIFFAAKNLLVLSLDVNRLMSLYTEVSKQKIEAAERTSRIEAADGDPRALAAIDMELPPPSPSTIHIRR